METPTAFQQFMDRRGLSQYRVAAVTGFSRSQVSAWQRGIHRPSKASARILAITLRLPIEDVLGQLETRERTQNARSPEGKFVPRTRKDSQNHSTFGAVNDAGRRGASYCIHCHRELPIAA